ncbi:cell growth-regulating nucleolar protein [Hoplias malabaricus]|uniref:cell growth-regulating nucleolar protein n=1 Tax=Hoplias malabaricus TaxID=27720 RepID=UPI0034629D30
MVVFTCSSCGESLKKAQIEKHRTMCRGNTCLSCIDCGKDFWGEDYKTHVRCISEDQKYGGKGYEAKAKKGDVKQQQWIQKVQEAMAKPGINPKLKQVLNQMSSYDNIPRKKAKFQNWMNNSLRLSDSRLLDQVWEIMSSADGNPDESQQPNGSHPSKPKPEPSQPSEPQQQQEEEKPIEKKLNKRERKEERQKKSKKKHAANGSTESQQNGEIVSEELQKKKKKKRKRDAEQCEEEEEKGVNEKCEPKRKKGEEPEDVQSLDDTDMQPEEQDESNTKGKFNWKGTIKAVLQQAPEEGLAVKKLRKKVLAAYYSFSGDGNYKSEEELFSVFNKKINNPKFKILKDKVRLVK